MCGSNFEPNGALLSIFKYALCEEYALCEVAAENAAVDTAAAERAAAEVCYLDIKHHVQTGMFQSLHIP